MTKITLLVFAALVVLAIFLFVAIAKSRASAESVDYRVARKDGAFELRDYPAMSLATTSMSNGGMNGSFRQLFRFITGSNAAHEQIPMTAPVLIERAGAKQTMSFIMPLSVAKREPPQPEAPEVQLEKMDAARFAVVRFSGRWTERNEEAALERLRAWLIEQKIATQGAPILAFYDPPWIPWFLRHNEVMLRVE